MRNWISFDKSAIDSDVRGDICNDPGRCANFQASVHIFGCNFIVVNDISDGWHAWAVDLLYNHNQKQLLSNCQRPYEKRCDTLGGFVREKDYLWCTYSLVGEVFSLKTRIRWQTRIFYEWNKLKNHQQRPKPIQLPLIGQFIVVSLGESLLRSGKVFPEATIQLEKNSSRVNSRWRRRT